MRSLLRSVFGIGGGDDKARVNVLFVCMGNICRSPSAEAVFRRLVSDAKLDPLIRCASAGTHDFHVGASPDGRARAAALNRGYDMSKIRGRHVADEDFERYDLILVMDRQNLDALEKRCPPEHRTKVKLLMEFARRHDALDVPDPYYGSKRGFEIVLDMIEDACGALLEHLRAQYLDDMKPDAAR